MTRKVMFFVLFAVGLFLVGCADQASIERLKSENKELSAKVANLEASCVKQQPQQQQTTTEATNTGRNTGQKDKCCPCPAPTKKKVVKKPSTPAPVQAVRPSPPQPAMYDSCAIEVQKRGGKKLKKSSWFESGCENCK